MESISSSYTLIWNMINEFYSIIFNLKGKPSEQLKKKMLTTKKSFFKTTIFGRKKYLVLPKDLTKNNVSCIT